MYLNGWGVHEDHQDPEIYFLDNINLGGDLDNVNICFYTYMNNNGHDQDEPYFFIQKQNKILCYIDMRTNSYFKKGTVNLSENQSKILDNYMKDKFHINPKMTNWDWMCNCWLGNNSDSKYYSSLEDIETQPDYSIIKENL